MEEELRALLLATGPVTALCGTRIDWTASPQGALLPRLVLGLTSGAEGATLLGRDGLFQGSAQIDAWAVTRRAAADLGRAVVARLHGYKGGGFSGVFLIATRDGREGGSGEADRPFRVSMDFTLNWRQA